MNTQLSLTRVRLLLLKYLFENRKSVPLMFLAVACFLSIWMTLHMAIGNPALLRERVQIAFYFEALFLSGCLYANSLFVDFNEKPRAISNLLLPASTLEKLICNLLFGLAIFWAGYTAVFYLVDGLAVVMVNRSYHTDFQIVNIFSINDYQNPFWAGKPNSNIFFIFFTVQTLFVLGSIFFKRYTLVKTSIGVFLIWLILYFFSITILDTILPLGKFKSGLAAYEIFHATGDRLVELPVWFGALLSAFFKFTLVPALLTVIYFKLREKEVA